MYAEVYRWCTETSGLGLMGQAAKLMDSKPATVPVVWLGLHNPHDADDIYGAVAEM